MKKTIGFIGLGIMGKPMAKNLLKAGYSLVAYDINNKAVEDVVKLGAQQGKSCCDVAARTEIIITMLPNSPHVESAVFGEQGIYDGARPGTILVDMSSIDPVVSRKLAVILEEKSVKFLDAPVSGGEPKAIDGTLSIMVGGEPAAFEEVKEILNVMGSSVVLTGEVGSGNVTKLANQIVVALNIAAVSEALVLAEKSGVNPETVFQAIRGGLAGSTVMDAKAPMMLDRNFKPGFRIELHHKDLTNAMDTAHKIGVPLPLTAQMLEILSSLMADGKGKDDHSGILQYFEKISGVEVKRG